MNDILHKEVIRQLKVRSISNMHVTYKRVSLLLICFTCTFTVAISQVAITTSGGNGAGSGGSVCYTIGQIAYSSSSGTNGSVIQGVQQPYEISVISGVNEANNINLATSVYPNPTTDLLTLKTAGFNGSLTYSLYDNKGKLLVSKKVKANETAISMKNYSPAIYFLKVIQVTNGSLSQEIKTFKIIKD